MNCEVKANADILSIDIIEFSLAKNNNLIIKKVVDPREFLGQFNLENLKGCYIADSPQNYANGEMVLAINFEASVKGSTKVHFNEFSLLQGTKLVTSLASPSNAIVVN